MIYDREADVVYFYIGKGTLDHTEKAGPFLYDVDAESRVLGIEVIAATRTIASDNLQQARPPGPR